MDRPDDLGKNHTQALGSYIPLHQGTLFDLHAKLRYTLSWVMAFIPLLVIMALNAFTESSMKQFTNDIYAIFMKYIFSAGYLCSAS